MELDDFRRSSVSSFEDIRQETSSPFRAVPKGSDVFQKAMVQLYTDIQKEKENRRQRKQNANLIDDDEEEEDFSDEERDKCTDIKQFRRFSQDFSAKQHHFRRTASLHHMAANNTGNAKSSWGSMTPSQISNKLSKVSEIRTQDKKQSQILRRHSIATLQPTD